MLDFSPLLLFSQPTLVITDVADKVIHVVNSRPPASSATSSATTSSPTPTSTTGSANRPSVSVSSVPYSSIGDYMSNMMAGLPPGELNITVYKFDLPMRLHLSVYKMAFGHFFSSC